MTVDSNFEESVVNLELFEPSELQEVEGKVEAFQMLQHLKSKQHLRRKRLITLNVLISLKN